MPRHRGLPGKSGCLFVPFRPCDPEPEPATGQPALTEEFIVAVALRQPAEEFPLAEDPPLFRVERADFGEFGVRLAALRQRLAAKGGRPC